MTYLHHYMPALYYVCLSLGFGVDGLLKLLPKWMRVAVFWTLAAVVAGVGYYFLDCAWGMMGSPDNYRGRAWREDWEF